MLLYFVVIIFTAVIVNLFIPTAREPEPKLLAPNDGRIRHLTAWELIIKFNPLLSRIIGGVFSIFIGVVVAMLIYFVINRIDLILAFARIILLFVIWPFLLLYLVRKIRASHIVWDKSSVAGPSSNIVMRFWYKRNKIKWNEIVKRGSVAKNIFFVETEDKRRVYWSNRYHGYSAFNDVVVHHTSNVNK